MAKEVAVGAVLDLREDGDGLFATGHVALRGAIVEPLHRAQCDLDVVLELAAFLLQQTLAGLGHFVSSQILQHPRRRTAEHQREEDDGNQRKQDYLGFQCQAHSYCPCVRNQKRGYRYIGNPVEELSDPRRRELNPASVHAFTAA